MWTISKQSEGWGTELIRKIKTSLTVKLFLLTTILLLFVCLLSVFSMARYIPQTYSNRLSKELQKQANDFVPVLERANSLEECYMLASQFAVQTKATVYIEDENGTILYSSDELQTTTDQDSIATIQESTDTIIVTTDNDELLSEIGYPFTLFGSEFRGIRYLSIKRQKQSGKPFHLLFLGFFLYQSYALAFIHATL